MTDTTRTPNGTRMTDAAQDALAATAQVIDSSRQLASKTAGRIGETARDLRDSAADYARTSAASIGDVADVAQRRAGQFARATRQRVEAAPLKAVLIAAAAGAAVAVVIGLFSRRDAD
ncbi:DUF883 family protein [Ramlibacter ginsenosidimutans]|uniref:DUF883 family protein n=1 Tax=Ramlibacter ginsenosidimutans TaxID=502333 RepID=A0A934WKE2_9BURK|nr:DUF883 family protein [Ramlibacter ginsenosidimutans]MBK6005644.1 DUF883 family protein [Ramlibacter ginsenosidimutans]